MQRERERSTWTRGQEVNDESIVLVVARLWIVKEKERVLIKRPEEEGETLYILAYCAMIDAWRACLGQVRHTYHTNTFSCHGKCLTFSCHGKCLTEIRLSISTYM